jgi:hypothetical protein
VLSDKQTIRQADNQTSRQTDKQTNHTMQQPDNQQPTDGYPEFVEPPPHDLICSICTEVLRDPVLVCCNHHTYCRGCIALSMARSNQCPECREEISREEPARKDKNRILLLDVRCPHTGCNGGGSPSSVPAATSCGWTGPMKNYEAHVAECPFGEISCPFADAGCAFRAARRDMGAHSSDAAAHLLLLMTSFAAVKAECAAVKVECAAECAAVKTECATVKGEGALVKAECAVVKAECAAVKAKNEVMKSDISSLQCYVAILHTTGEEAAAGGMEWVSSRTVPDLNRAFTYTGQMRGGKCHGFGRASWATGDYVSYDGQWKDGKMHGQGILKERDGCIYEGQWKEGKMQGQGICKLSNGASYEYSNGASIFTKADGSRYNCVYEDGVITSSTPIM